MKNLFLALLVTLGSSLLITACGSETKGFDEIQPLLLESIIANTDLSTFRSLLERAGLNDTLSNRPELTVFAPTNAAFEAFRVASGYAALTDIPIPELKQLLLYHLLPVKLKSNDFLSGYLLTLAKYAPNNSNQLLYFTTNNGFKANGVTVISADNQTQTGFLHVVNAVLKLPTVVTTTQNDPNFSTFYQALTRADLGIDYVSTLSGAGPFTIFAPTNDAFAEFLTGLGYSTLNDIPTGTLNAILQYHIVAGANLTGNNLLSVQQLTTLGGKKFTITNGTQFTDNLGGIANLLIGDIQTSNGIVQRVDKVMRPN